MNRAPATLRAPDFYWVLCAAVAGWATMVLDFVLGIYYFDGLGGAVHNHVLYFTLWSNTFATICLSAGALKLRRGRGGFFADANTVTAMATSMIIVSLVYNLVLRHGHVIRGAYRITNEMTHVVMPLLFVVFWWRCSDRRVLSRRVALLWTGYPLVYALYFLIQGRFTGNYPYFFADPSELGYATVFRNAVVLLLVFAGINVLLTRIAQRSANAPTG